MLIGERKQRAVEMLRELQADVVDDVNRREGQPFTGANVAAALGEMCAQINALAKVLVAILEDDDATAAKACSPEECS